MELFNKGHVPVPKTYSSNKLEFYGVSMIIFELDLAYKDLLFILMSGICFNLVYFGFMQVIFPGKILNEMGLSTSSYASLLSMQGVGAFLGGLIYRQFLKVLNMKKLFMLVLIGLVICFLILIKQPPIELIRAIYILMGGFSIILMISLAVIWQTSIPKHVIGSYMTSINAFIILAVLISYLLVPIIYKISIFGFYIYTLLCLGSAVTFSILSLNKKIT